MVTINSRFTPKSIFYHVVVLVYCGAVSPRYLKADESTNTTDIVATINNATYLDTYKGEPQQDKQAMKDTDLSNDFPLFFSPSNQKKLQPQLSQQVSKKQMYSSDRKSTMKGSIYDHRNLCRQQEKYIKEKIPIEQQYRTTRIKESETAERNLKELLKILNENMSFQFGGIPQPKERDQATNKKRKPVPPQDECYPDETMRPIKEYQISEPKAFKSEKDNSNEDALHLIEEIVKKELIKVLNRKIGYVSAKDVPESANNQTQKRIGDWVRVQKMYNQMINQPIKN